VTIGRKLNKGIKTCAVCIRFALEWTCNWGCYLVIW